MREKNFYIEEVAKMLSKCDNDTIKAVYVALGRLTKGDRRDGLKKTNNTYD